MKKVLLIAFSIFMAGCVNRDMTDLQQYVEDVRNRPPAPIDPIPQIRQAETFLYIIGGRRNPFEPEAEGEGFLKGVASGTGPSPDLNRRKEELEHYSLDNLQMVGTLAQKGDFWGLVQTADGTIHRVQPGNHMGRNYGLITDISEDHIDLRELIREGDGYSERQASLALENIEDQ